jgi:ATP-dependent exoDNAse (exonuclease V) beta subunit
VLAFLKWKTDNDVEFLEVERLVYSKQYEYVGRFDLIAKVNGKKMLIDYKTSKGFYPMEMGMQTA